MKARKFTTRRLVVRPLRLSDFKAWVTHLSTARPPRNRYELDLSTFSRSLVDFRKRVRAGARRAEDDDCYIWWIFRSSNELIGRVDIKILERGPVQVANLGYRIDNRYWGKGYGSEAVKALIPIALKDLKLNRLEAVIDPGNRRSQALARKVGMTREGVRKSYFYQNRDWADQVVYSIHRKDLGIPVLHL